MRKSTMIFVGWLLLSYGCDDDDVTTVPPPTDVVADAAADVVEDVTADAEDVPIGDVGDVDGTGTATGALQEALTAELAVMEALSNPAIQGDVAQLRTAVAQVVTQLAGIRDDLTRARDLATGDARTQAQSALDEVDAMIAIAAVVATAQQALVSAHHQEMIARGGVSTSSTNLALRALDAGPSADGAGHVLQTSELTVPSGYTAEIVANNLSFASVVTIGDDGTVYIGEAGFSYGNVQTPARVMRLRTGTTTPEVVAQGFTGPLAGIAVQGTQMYVSHRGKISAVNLATVPTGGVTGTAPTTMTDIIANLPSNGDHFNQNIAVGPDGRIYMTQGTATNMGVVGVDNYLFGWLRDNPDVHDIACRNLTLSGVNYRTGNPLTADPSDTVETGAYSPFGAATTAGQSITGALPCNGAIMRMNADGSGLELIADGLRNPYALRFRDDGALWITENGPDFRGSRPFVGPDNLWLVSQGGWYGFPDFVSGNPVTQPPIAVGNDGLPIAGPSVPSLLALLQNPPTLALTTPFGRFPAHSAPTGFDIARGATFATANEMFVALFGGIEAANAGVELEAGHKVVRVLLSGNTEDFLTSQEYPDGEPFLRPTGATFNTAGDTLYVTHFGELRSVPGGIFPSPNTGALIRITRTAAP